MKKTIIIILCILVLLFCVYMWNLSRGRELLNGSETKTPSPAIASGDVPAPVPTFEKMISSETNLEGYVVADILYDRYYSEAGQTSEGILCTLSQGDSTIRLYRNFLWGETYNIDHKGWLNADCMSAEWMLLEIVDELPTIYSDDTITFDISENAKLLYIRVYNSEYERVYFNISEGEFQSLYGALESGTYYISAVVTYSGKYIEALDEYESLGDEFTFKFIVERDAAPSPEILEPEMMIPDNVDDYIVVDILRDPHYSADENTEPTE